MAQNTIQIEENQNKKKPKPTKREKSVSNDLNTRIEMIQALTPTGLMAVYDQLKEELKQLTGERYSRQSELPGHRRWGSQPRSIYLSDQKIRVDVTRVRNSLKNGEVPLLTCQAPQSPRRADEALLRRILLGLSCRNYASCAEAVPEAFGLSSSTVSRRFIKAATENERALKGLLSSLLDRGLSIEEGILCVIDGAKGLYSGIRRVFQDRALVQRCQWHKRENVVSYLPKSHPATWRRRLQRAYEKPTYEKAKAALNRLKPELKHLNESALASLEEGLGETLTLHRLGLFPQLGISLKTTNCIESVMSLVGQHTDKVDYWKSALRNIDGLPRPYLK